MKYNENNIKIFFRNFCDSLLNQENKIKEQRIRLSSLLCFSDSFGYFKYLDKNKKNYIDKSDISTFLSINKIKFTKHLLNNIFKKYDKDSDSCWNFSEYFNFINKDLKSNFNNNLSQIESNIQNYEKELAKLFELEINNIKYLGIKAKSLKELINDKIINTKNIFILINKEKTKIDANSLMIFLNDGKYYIDKEKAYKIIEILSNGKNFITEKHLDNIFNYDKYINDAELIYPQNFNNIDYRAVSSYNNYYTQFPLNNFGFTNYNTKKLTNENKLKDKFKELNTNNQYDFQEIQNNLNDNINNEIIYYNTYIDVLNDNNQNPMIISNNSLSQQENIYSFSFNEFSFRK